MPQRELPECVDRLIRVFLELRQDGPRPAVRLGDGLGEPDLDLQRDKMLLGTVVEVALDAPTFLVLSGDQALT